MALIASKRPNGGYSGKHRAAATALVKAGTRVGFVWIDSETATFFCHVCNKEQVKPSPLEQVNGKADALTACPGCKTPFIMAEFV